MKRSILSALLLAGLVTGRAEVIPFDLSPAGTDKAVGLSPSNEVGTVIGSTGSGNEILSGITFNTTNRLLSLSVGYGSAAGFADLTSPVAALHIHGPAGPGTNAGVLIDLSSVHLKAGDPATGGVIFGGVSLTETQAVQLLSGLYYINLHTPTNAGGEIRGQLIPLFNDPPTITCPSNTTLECRSRGRARATVTINVSDVDGDALEVIWKINGIAVKTNKVEAGTPQTTAAVSLQAVFESGKSVVEATVSDGRADPVTCSTEITVVDTKAPKVDWVKAWPSLLWPPDHRMVPVRIRIDAHDDCSAVKGKIVSITSDEPVDGYRDGSTTPDWRITDDLTAELRAERSGAGNGRVYTLTVEISDSTGNKVTKTVRVCVPHSMSRGEGHDDDDRDHDKDKDDKDKDKDHRDRGLGRDVFRSGPGGTTQQ